MSNNKSEINTALDKAKADGAEIFLETAGLNFKKGTKHLRLLNHVDFGNVKIQCVATGKKTVVKMLTVLPVVKREKAVIVVTDRSVYILRKTLFKRSVAHYEPDKLTGFESSIGIIGGGFTLIFGIKQIRITNLKKEAVKCLSKCVIFEKI